MSFPAFRCVDFRRNQGFLTEIAPHLPPHNPATAWLGPLAAGAPLRGVVDRGILLCGDLVHSVTFLPPPAFSLLVLVLVHVLVLLSCPGALDYLNLLRELCADHHQLGEHILCHLHLCLPYVGQSTLFLPVQLLVRLCVGLVRRACSLVVLEGAVPPVAEGSARMNSLVDNGGSPARRGSFFLLFFKPC